MIGEIKIKEKKKPRYRKLHLCLEGKGRVFSDLHAASLNGAVGRIPGGDLALRA